MLKALVLSALLAQSAPSGPRLDDVLIAAVEAGNAARVATLLSQGANPNARQSGAKEEDFARLTALMIATAQKRADIVKQLLAAGATVDAKDEMNATALMIAVSSDSPASLEILDILVSAGANVKDFQGALGRNPILSALAYGNKAGVKILISAGADVNAQGGEGETISPLMLAAARGFAEVCEWLLVAGAQVNARSEQDGRTALDYALAEKQATVAEILRKHGGKRSAELGSA